MNNNDLTSGRLIARNTFISIVGQAIPFVVGVITIPIIQKEFAMDRFGLLSMIWFTIGFFTFSDLGLGRAIIKLVAERIGQKNESEVSVILWTSLAVMLFVSGLGSLVLVFIAPTLVSGILHIPSHLIGEALQSMYVLAFTLIPVVLTAGIRGVMEAKQEFVFINILHAIMGTLTYGSPLLVLAFTHNTFWVVAVLAIFRWLSLFFHIGFTWVSYPDLVRPIRISRAWLPRLFKFGGWVTISNLLISLKVYLDRFFLGALVPISQIPYYTTPMEILSRILLIPGALVRVLFPAFAARRAQAPEKLTSLFERGIKTVAFVLFLVVWLLVYWGEEAFKVWLGADFAIHATLVLQVLAIGIFFNGVAWIPFTLIQSAERADITAKIHLYELVFYSVVLFVGASNWGLIGAAVARSAVECLDLILLFSFVKRLSPLDDNSRKIISESKYIFAIGLICLAPGFFSMELSTRLTISIALLLIYVVFFGTWILNLEDRVYLKHYLLAKISNINQSITLNHSTIERVCAVVVSYQPEKGLVERIAEHLKQFDWVMVINNMTSPEDESILNKLEAMERVTLKRNFANLGIADALNFGVAWAKDNGFQWIATFDQDSRIPKDYLRKMRLALRRASRFGAVGILAPAHRDIQTGLILVPRFDEILGHIRFVTVAITSGNLIPIKVFEKIGEYDKELFIDYVDHDFCLRVLESGLRIVEVQDIHLEHNLGNPKWYRVGPWTFMVTHHSALRRYYITRNRFLMYRRYWWLEPSWVFQDFGRFVKETLKIVVYEAEKPKKLMGMINGIFDAVRGQLGPRTGR